MNLQPCRFFLVVPLDFEQLAAAELTRKWPQLLQLLSFFKEIEIINSPPPIDVLHGGLEIELPAIYGYLLNVILKIPTRILKRLDSFKCSDFPKLYKKIKKISWHEYLKGQVPIIEASAQKSRLYHTDRIKKCALSAIQDFYQARRPTKEALEEAKTILGTTIYIRFEDDLCTVSIDTSGEALYKRAYKQFIGKAPMRENLAAGLLDKMLWGKGFQEKEKITLIDPMCGSGTFLWEFLLSDYPMMMRDYSFFSFPSFKNYLADYQKLRLSSDSNLAVSPFQFEHLYGFDNDETVIEGLTSNLRRVQEIGQGQGQGQGITIQRKDLFNDTDYKKQKYNNSVVVVNPPYGERLEMVSYRKIIDTIMTRFRPILVGLILPLKASKLLQLGKNYLIKDRFTFSHGGIKLELIVLENRR